MLVQYTIYNVHQRITKTCSLILKGFMIICQGYDVELIYENNSNLIFCLIARGVKDATLENAENSRIEIIIAIFDDNNCILLTDTPKMLILVAIVVLKYETVVKIHAQINAHNIEINNHRNERKCTNNCKRSMFEHRLPTECKRCFYVSSCVKRVIMYIQHV